MWDLVVIWLFRRCRSADGRAGLLLVSDLYQMVAASHGLLTPEQSLRLDMN